MFFKTQKRSKSTVNIRNFAMTTAICMLLFPTSYEVTAEAAEQKPPEMLSYNQVDVPGGSIFEHRKDSMSFTAIQGDDIVTKTIGAYGHIRLESNFSAPLEYVSDVFQSADQGYLLAGGNEIYKVTKDGEVEWTYAMDEEEVYIRSIDQLLDGSFVGVASAHNNQTNTNRISIIQLSSTGEVTRRIEVQDELFDGIQSIQSTSDGGFVLSGEVYRSGQTEENIYLAKYDHTGSVVWKQYLTPADDSQNIKVLSITEGIDGQIVASGYYNHPNPDGGYRYLTTGFVLAVDAEGSKQWLKTPDPALDRSMLNDIQPTPEGGYIATGKVNEDWHGTVATQWVWKLDSNGNTKWTKSIHRANYDAGVKVQPLSNGQSLLIGTADGLTTLIKIDADK